MKNPARMCWVFLCKKRESWNIHVIINPPKGGEEWVLTYREEEMWRSLSKHDEKWRADQGNFIQDTYDFFFERLMKKIPEVKREVYFHTLDSGLFQLHSFIQSSSFQLDLKKKIVSRARIFDEKIDELKDLKALGIDKLMYIADSEISRHRIYSLVQGGVTGLGGVPLFLSDLPLMAILNLKVVQLIGMCYGYDSIIPFEMMISLKVFHGGTMPKRMQEEAWNELMEEVKNREDDYFYLGTERLTDYTWLEQPLRQILKMFVIQMMKKKIIQGVPIVGVGVGAITNYQLTRQVTEFAHRFYQYRFLMEKKEEG